MNKIKEPVPPLPVRSNAGLEDALKFPWEVEGGGFWSKQGREKFRQERINFMPQDTTICISLNDEDGIFTGKVVDGKFIMDCGGILGGYWISRVSNWASPNVEYTPMPVYIP